MFICSNCTSITNRTNLIQERDEPDKALKAQVDSADGFYSQKIDDMRSRGTREMLSFLNRLLGGKIAGKNMVDVGAGEGYLAAAACSFYDTAWAVDVNVGLLDKMVPQFELGDKLRVAASLEAVPGSVDAVFMWHALEHFPNSQGIGLAIASKLNEGGFFIWQVPAYRDSHVVYSHYTFFNDYSARVFTESIGLKIVDIFHDENLQFLTVVSRKP
jgi:2-polyprenyl-3-methyl-5-hydroxy-6-metoxy-1,4-benzoquinol methylase